MPGDDKGEVTVSIEPINSDRRLGDGYNSSEEWASSEWTLCAPHISAIRRATCESGVIARIGSDGRLRESRATVVPLDVNPTMATAPMLSASPTAAMQAREPQAAEHGTARWSIYGWSGC
jgi:hypothetical protein